MEQWTGTITHHLMAAREHADTVTIAYIDQALQHVRREHHLHYLERGQ